MLRSIGFKIVKVSALILCLGVGASACWGYGRGGHDGRDGRDDHHDEHREEHR
jgi:hypothetical protein